MITILLTKVHVFFNSGTSLKTVKELGRQGHGVVDIRGTDDQGITDEVLRQKTQELQCLVTSSGASLPRSDNTYHLTASPMPDKI